MRTIFFMLVLMITWAAFPIMDSGMGLPGIRSLEAMKAPTIKERRDSVSHPDQQKKAAWFGRPSRTTDGRFCNCGVSKGDKNKCYYPEAGQVCRNPETGETHMVKIEDWNNPAKAFEHR